MVSDNFHNSVGVPWRTRQGCAWPLGPGEPYRGSNSVINTADIDLPLVTGDLVPLCVCTAELLPLSVPPCRSLLRFRIRWISIRSFGGGAVAGHGGKEAGSSPRKGEVNHKLDDSVPPELVLLLVKTGPHAGFLHFGKPRRRLQCGLPCLLQTQTIAGGHESHRDGDGEGEAPFPRGIDIAPFIVAAIHSGVVAEAEQGGVVRVPSRAVLGLGLLHPRSEPGFHGDLLATGHRRRRRDPGERVRELRRAQLL